MPELHDAASMARKGRMSFTIDEKSEVLRKLQGRIYFEKSLSASSVSRDMALPAWFVRDHGDKFRKSVILRTESSTRSWTVKLSISRRSPICTRVRFCGGWKDFATSNGLLEGDLLMFSLTAMSEFEVYIFPGTRNPKRCTSQDEPREWSEGSEPPRKKAKEEPYDCKDEQLDDEGGSEDAVKLNGLFAKKKTVGEERVVPASSYSSTSCRPSSNNEELHQRISRNIRFEKTLSPSNVSKLGKCALALPTWFVEEHGNKSRKSVILRSGSSTKPWHVNLIIDRKGLRSRPTVKFGGGWKAFVAFHGLLVGDLLVFSLMAMSEFEVYIFSSARSPEQCPSQGGPKESSDGSELSWKASKQSKERKSERVPAEGLLAKKTEMGAERKLSGSGFSSKSCTRLLDEFPSFLKKLIVSNFGGNARMEIPLGFWEKYGSRLHSDVQLQWIHEDSPVRTMACLTTRGNQVRHFLRVKWKDFANENNLEVGQELLFALTAGSFFVVREVLPPSREI